MSTVKPVAVRFDVGSQAAVLGRKYFCTYLRQNRVDTTTAGTSRRCSESCESFQSQVGDPNKDSKDSKDSEYFGVSHSEDSETSRGPDPRWSFRS